MRKYASLPSALYTPPCGTTATEISTRRRSRTGKVHEMADRGVGTLCGRELPDPWVFTDEAVSCRDCLRRAEAQRSVPCTTTTPEPHERGEFPMSCYACHMWADS